MYTVQKRENIPSLFCMRDWQSTTSNIFRLYTGLTVAYHSKVYTDVHNHYHDRSVYFLIFFYNFHILFIWFDWSMLIVAVFSLYLSLKYCSAFVFTYFVGNFAFNNSSSVWFECRRSSRNDIWNKKCKKIMMYAIMICQSIPFHWVDAFFSILQEFHRIWQAAHLFRIWWSLLSDLQATVVRGKTEMYVLIRFFELEFLLSCHDLPLACHSTERLSFFLVYKHRLFDLGHRGHNQSSCIV